MPIHEFKHIRRIRQDFQASQRIKDSLNNSIQKLANDLYSKDTHFIFELIQNAEDNSYGELEPSLSFLLTKSDPTCTPGAHGALIVENNEEGFSPDNIDAICAVGKTTKSKIQGYIGEKGIGFKSVFRVTTTPHILSNGYCFCLPEHDIETGLGYIVPRWTGDLFESFDPSKTTIILPLNKEGFDYEKIFEMLCDIDPETILFLSKLKKIEISTDAGEVRTYSKRDDEMPLVQILIEFVDTEGEYSLGLFEFLLYSQSFNKPRDIKQEKREEIKDREVSIAFSLTDDENIGKIFAYLPVRSDTGLPFLINADFVLPSSREDIQEAPWNRWLMHCVARLVAEALPLLKERKLLTVSFLQIFATRLNTLSEDEDSIFYPIAGAVREALINGDLLPTDDGTFVAARNAKLARGADLRTLLNQDQLSFLFKTDNRIKWLSREITENRTPSLRHYLIGQLEIEEMRPERVVELLDDIFLESQSDQWLIDFYKFLGDKPDLWKAPSATLRTKKIIRLEDNSHVVPFKIDGTPNAYLPTSEPTNFPTIKESIFLDEDAADFLKRLGIIEPDIFAEILEFVLPKYTGDGIIIGKLQNLFDLTKIKRLLEEPFQAASSNLKAKLRILLGKLGLAKYEDYFSNQEPSSLIPNLLKIALPSSRILRSSNGRTIEYKSPEDIYENREDLFHYFQNDSDVWFVCEDYPAKFRPLFQEIGINMLPKVKKRAIDKNGFVNISDSHGHHIRGINGFDPDIHVDGLEKAIINPNIETSAFIWNNIAAEHWACIRGVLEKSSKKTFVNSKRENQVSKFGRLLTNTAWLPNTNGGFLKPNYLFLDDLPDRYEKNTPRAKSLSIAINMKQPEHERALEIVTGGDSDLKMLIEHYNSSSSAEKKKLLKLVPAKIEAPEPAPSFKDGLKELARLQRGTIEEGYRKKHPVSDPERYQEKLNEAVVKGVEEFKSTLRKITFSNVRNTSSNVGARRFLYEQYHGCCQVTGTTFPKASSNNDRMAENYFEICSLLSYSNADYLNDAGNMLCVSADTLAKLKYASLEFIEDLEHVIERFRAYGGSTESISVKIRLAREECFIQWSQRHFMRLVALYQEA